MEEIKSYVENLIESFGMHDQIAKWTTFLVLILIAIFLAAAVGFLCKRIFVPLLLRLSKKTDARWDDVIFNEKVLNSACQIIPAVIIWQLLPLIFFQHSVIADIAGRITALYITVMSVRTISVFIDSFKLLGGEKRTSHQQYLYSLLSVVKIVMFFLAAIVVIAIIVNKNPATLLAGLGAISAILMLAFQDTIKGLVAGIHLTNNDMLHIGDWITITSAGVNGRVEEITLTMVKVRNFDNTIVTVSPQALVDGSFQNWLGMEENEGRKQSRKVYFDFHSLKVDEEGVANITRFRLHLESWLKENPKVIGEKNPLVHQIDTPQASGCCLELVFWLKDQAWADFEHATSDIMEYVYAKAPEYGLTIYQPQYQSTLSE